ncbi:MAG: hypothetical protein M3Y59_21780 [Myxococcota bacterium]|nr:hypothetical protein [Myxococcota bacterium]
MRTRHSLLGGLAALGLLAFATGCGGSSAAPSPGDKGRNPVDPPPVTTEVTLTNWAVAHILSETSDTAMPVPLPGAEVIDVETVEPFNDPEFFR